MPVLGWGARNHFYRQTNMSTAFASACWNSPESLCLIWKKLGRWTRHGVTLSRKGGRGWVWELQLEKRHEMKCPNPSPCPSRDSPEGIQTPEHDPQGPPDGSLMISYIPPCACHGFPNTLCSSRLRSLLQTWLRPSELRLNSPSFLLPQNSASLACMPIGLATLASVHFHPCCLHSHPSRPGSSLNPGSWLV